MTWLGAPDEAAARQVRTDLEAGGHYWAGRNGGA